MEKRQRKLNIGNDRGSTLVLVIVCMFFISIIGMMILSITVLNVEMKTVAKQSTENFYESDSSIEEFTTLIRQKATDAYKEAYVNLLQNYVKVTNEEDRKDKFFRCVVDVLLPSKLHESDDTVTVEWDELSGTEFANIVSFIKGKLVPAGGDLKLKSVYVDANPMIRSITLNDVELDFYDSTTGYQTVITTDVVLDIKHPEVSLGYSTLSDGISDSEYVVIANGDIQTSVDGGTGTGSPLTVAGSLYSGKNIAFYNSQVLYTGKRLIAGSDLRIPLGTTLNAVINRALDDGFWVRNINMLGGHAVLQGDCYVADDLTFEVPGSDFTMTGGIYNGYSYTNEGERNPAFSSAIIMNCPDITLDMTNAEKLWVVGNAFVFDESMGISDGVLEGESIAYKNMQTAYLVPGICMIGVNHNPVMMSDRFIRSAGSTLEISYLVKGSVAERTTSRGITLPAGAFFPADTNINGTTIPAGITTMEYALPSGQELPENMVFPVGTEAPFDISIPITEMLTNRGADGKYFKEDGYYVDISRSKASGRIDLERFVDAFDAFVVRTVSSTQTSFYLNFRSARDAADYYRAYMEDGELATPMLQQINSLGASRVSLPTPENMITRGNKFTYNGVNQFTLLEATNVNNSTLFTTEYSLTKKYNALLGALNSMARANGAAVVGEVPATRYSTSDVDVFSYLVNKTKLEARMTVNAANELCLQKHEAVDGTEFYLCAAWNRDVVCSNLKLEDGTPFPTDELINTVIITNQKVIVDRNFKGLIIAGEDVSITSNRHLLGGTGCSSIAIDRIRLDDLLAHDIVGTYFNAYQNDSNTGGNQLVMDKKVLISFTNWRKNDAVDP